MCRVNHAMGTHGVKLGKIKHVTLLLTLCLCPFISSSQNPSVPLGIPIFSVIGEDASRSFRTPLGIFYDRLHDEIYIADTGNHRVAILDRDGYPLHSFPHFVTRAGKRIPGEPKSVAVDSRGRIYLVDALDRNVEVLDPQGIVLGVISPGEFIDGVSEVRAESVHIDGIDHLYIGVSGSYTGVLALDNDWNLRGTYPHLDQPANIQSIAGIAVDSHGDLYIADPTGIPAVRIYSKDGNERLAFGQHDIGMDNFSRPSGLSVEESGRIWIVDMIRQVVKAFDPQGRYIAYIGGRGSGAGSLDYPSAVATDGGDRLYVLNRGYGGLVCFEVSSEDT